MKVKIINVRTAASLGVTTSTLAAMSQLVHAQFIDDAQAGIEDIDNGGSVGTVPDILQNIVNLLLFLVGAISVIMLIIGGIRFIVSSGDAQQAASARNTILYSIIGVIVAVIAYGLVNFVLDSLYNAPATNETPASSQTQPLE